jgi:uncharacterized phiE125 gp8 family phage protein
MKLKRTSSPAVEPITLAEAKDHMRVTTTGDDSVISFELTDARVWLEKEMGVQMISCGWAGYLDAFPDKTYIEIPLFPITGVQAVEYFAPDGTSYTTLSTGTYIFDEFHIPPRIYLAPNGSWPSTEDRVNAVKITFNAGFNTAADVPDNWKRALKMLLLNIHDHRGDEGLVTIPRSIMDMVNMDKLISI